MSFSKVPPFPIAVCFCRAARRLGARAASKLRAGSVGLMEAEGINSTAGLLPHRLYRPGLELFLTGSSAAAPEAFHASVGC